MNEDADVAILLAEHRLERCLGLADRVIALDRGRVVCDASPQEFLRVGDRQALRSSRRLGRDCSSGLGLRPAAGVKAARAALRERGLHRGL